LGRHFPDLVWRPPNELVKYGLIERGHVDYQVVIFLNVREGLKPIDALGTFVTFGAYYEIDQFDVLRAPTRFLIDDGRSVRV
jgi:hypothetical protein